MCQRVTRMAADVLCSEQYPSTSYARGSPRSCYASTVPSRSISNQALAFFPIVALPTEIHLRILQNLPRSDLDNCSLVCKQWAAVIERNAHALPKHHIKAIQIEAHKSSFKIMIKSSTIPDHCPRKWSFEGAESAKPKLGYKRRMLYDPEAPPAKLASMILYIDPAHPTISTASPFIVPIVLPQNEQDDVNDGFRYALPPLNGNEYENEDDEFAMFPPQSADRFKQKQSFHTPPQAMFDRIKRCFDHAQVGTFRVQEFRITDGFVDKWEETFREGSIKCNALKMRFCKLRYVSKEKFSSLIQSFKTSSLTMEWIRGEDGHFSMPEVVDKLSGKCRHLDMSMISTEGPLYDNSFLASFVRNPFSNKIIRLNCCSVDEQAILQAVQDWKASPTLLFEHVCIKSELIDWTFVVNSLFGSVANWKKCFMIQHPTLSNCLRVWMDVDGVHLSFV